MKTRHIIIAAAALTMAGCRQDAPQTETIDPSNLRFEVAVTQPNEDGAETRAVKTGWTEGDAIVVHFDGSEQNTLWLRYNAAGEWETTESSVATINPAGGSAQALHSTFLSNAGDGVINADGAHVFTDTGSYIVAGGTVYVSLTMDRRIASRITVRGVDDPSQWVLAGPGLYVGTPILSGTFDTAGGSWGATLHGSFVASDIEYGVCARGMAMPWEEPGTASFMVIGTPATEGTTIVMKNVATNRTYTRTYASGGLGSGKAVAIQAPREDQNVEWVEILKLVENPATFTCSAPKAGAIIPSGFSCTPPADIAACECEWSGGSVGVTTFAYNTVYTLTIMMKAAAGYTFEGGYGDTASVAGFTVNGAAPQWVSNNGKTLTVSYTFEPTGPVPGNDVGYDPPQENKW